jgi:hypothetical protein
VFAAVVMGALQASGPQAQSATELQSARTWLDRAPEIEAFLRSAEMLKFEDLSVGVTKPKRAWFAPGGPVESIAWKVLPPGRYGGYWESYQSEIAAYELDKMLDLDMVPPTVEKVYRGERGAAVAWVKPVKSFKDMGSDGAPQPPGRLAAGWVRQMVRAKMFHNMVANLDPNLGNWLVDPAWNLILIDCTRCFTNSRAMTHELTRFDEPLWLRMRALTEESLQPVLGSLMGRGELRAILQRRDRLQTILDGLIKKNGEDAALMRSGLSPGSWVHGPGAVHGPEAVHGPRTAKRSL